MSPFETSHHPGRELGQQHPASRPLWVSGKFRALGQTHKGMVREANQDHYLVSNALGLLMVADGMGGHAGGEVASHLAVEVVSQLVEEKNEELNNASSMQRRALFQQIVNNASLKVYERSLEMPKLKGMGTTSTLLWLPKLTFAEGPYLPEALIAHVGDSRCYLLRAGILFLMTNDHSLVSEQMRAGMIKPGSAQHHQYRNVITRCVGVREEEEVDTFVQPLFEGDRFLICSDGFSNKVTQQEIVQLMSSERFESIPEECIRLANARGGDDNISIVVTEIL